MWRTHGCRNVANSSHRSNDDGTSDGCQAHLELVPPPRSLISLPGRANFVPGRKPGCHNHCYDVAGRSVFEGYQLLGPPASRIARSGGVRYQNSRNGTAMGRAPQVGAILERMSDDPTFRVLPDGTQVGPGWRQPPCGQPFEVLELDELGRERWSFGVLRRWQWRESGWHGLVGWGNMTEPIEVHESSLRRAEWPKVESKRGGRSRRR